MVGRKPAGPGRLKKSNGTTNEVASSIYHVLPVDDFLKLELYTLKNATLEEESCENMDSSPRRDRLKGEVIEVHRIMLPSVTCLLQPHCLKCKRKLSSIYHIANLESITTDGDTTGQNVEG